MSTENRNERIRVGMIEGGDEFPHIPKPLLDELTRRFPDQMPGRVTDLADLNFKAGQVAVVRFLRMMFNEQEERGMESVKIG